MKIVFLSVQSQNSVWAEGSTAELQTKIRHLFPNFETQNLSSKKLARVDRSNKVEKESEEILELVTSTDLLVLFDEQGKALSSIEFSKKMENLLSSGKKRLIFLIGGAFGVDERVKTRADLKLKLSDFTMNHLVAKIVALEQVYRAFAIRNGLPYHNE